MSDKTKKIAELNNLSKKELIKRANKFSELYRIGNGKKFKLKHYPAHKKTINKNEKHAAKERLQEGIEALASLQDILYAQDSWSVLLIFQAMDAAGKDGAIKHVMSGVNPQGCQVFSFKAPSAEDMDHDFMWRCTKNLPERGRIGIFNRSYYEEVLVARVHEDILAKQKLHKKLVTKKIWEERFADIKNFEEYLYRNGTVVVKFFLNVSKDEQKKRFLERIDTPEKNWKFSVSDIKERGHWDDYMAAYEDMIINTSTDKSSWYVIPADDKIYARIAVASAVINTLVSLNLEYPKVGKEKIEELEKVKQLLLSEH